MEIFIKNGVTIIKTGDSNGGVKNKHNQTGVSTYYAANGSVQYKAEIQVNRKKYYLGVRDNVEDAAALRLEAEEHINNNTFHEWLKELKAVSHRSKRIKGVSERKRLSGTKYQAEIRVDGKRYYLGNRKTPEEATALVEEARTHKDAGTFEEWLHALKNA